MSDQMEITIRVLSEEEVQTRGLTGSDVWASFSVSGQEIALTDDYGTATVLSAYEPYEHGVTIKEAVETMNDACSILWELAMKRDPVADACRAAADAIEHANNVTIEATTTKVQELYPAATAYAIARDSNDDGSYFVQWIENEDEQVRWHITDDTVERMEPIQEIVGNLWTDGPLSGVEGWVIKLRDEDVIDPSELNPTETSCRPADWIDPDDVSGPDSLPERHEQ